MATCFDVAERRQGWEEAQVATERTHRSVSFREPPATPFSIEFYGGPFDGFIYDASGTMPMLPFFVAMPISANAIGASRSSRVDAFAKSHSVAYYELSELQAEWCYRFIAVVRQQPRDIAGWPRRILLRVQKLFRRGAE